MLLTRGGAGGGRGGRNGPVVPGGSAGRAGHAAAHTGAAGRGAGTCSHRRRGRDGRRRPRPGGPRRGTRRRGRHCISPPSRAHQCACVCVHACAWVGACVDACVCACVCDEGGCALGCSLVSVCMRAVYNTHTSFRSSLGDRHAQLLGEGGRGRMRLRIVGVGHWQCECAGDPLPRLGRLNSLSHSLPCGR
jgi:hypothetical protein